MVAKPTCKFERLNRMSGRGWEAHSEGWEVLGDPPRGPGRVRSPYRRNRTGQ